MPRSRPTRRDGLIALALAAIAFGAAAQEAPVLGRWLTEDRDGVVETYPCGTEFCGRIVWYAKQGERHRDGNNPDPALRARPICGLQVLGGFKPDGSGGWKDGWAYAPETGKTYRAQLGLRDARTMELRGYVGIPLFGEPQGWARGAGARPPCVTG